MFWRCTCGEFSLWKCGCEKLIKKFEEWMVKTVSTEAEHLCKLEIQLSKMHNEIEALKYELSKITEKENS